MDYTAMTDDELTARYNALEAQRAAIKEELRRIAAVRDARVNEARLHLEAARYSPEELARMLALRQEIAPPPAAAGETMGEPGAVRP